MRLLTTCLPKTYLRGIRRAFGKNLWWSLMLHVANSVTPSRQGLKFKQQSSVSRLNANPRHKPTIPNRRPKEINLRPKAKTWPLPFARTPFKRDRSCRLPASRLAQRWKVVVMGPKMMPTPRSAWWHGATARPRGANQRLQSSARNLKLALLVVVFFIRAPWSLTPPF